MGLNGESADETAIFCDKIFVAFDKILQFYDELNRNK